VLEVNTLSRADASNRIISPPPSPLPPPPVRRCASHPSPIARHVIRSLRFVRRRSRSLASSASTTRIGAFGQMSRRAAIELGIRLSDSRGEGGGASSRKLRAGRARKNISSQLQYRAPIETARGFILGYKVRACRRDAALASPPPLPFLISDEGCTWEGKSHSPRTCDATTSETNGVRPWFRVSSSLLAANRHRG